MKASALTISLLLLLSAAGIGTCHQLVSGQGQVELTEHTLTGDPAAAEGLSLQLTASWRTYDRTPRFLTEFTPGEQPRTRLKSLPLSRKSEPANLPHIQLSQSEYTSAYSGGSHSIADMLDPSDPIDRKVLELADQIGPNEEKTVSRIPVAELTPVYKPALDLQLGENSFLSSYAQDEYLEEGVVHPQEHVQKLAFLRSFRELFQFPVSEADAIDILVEKNSKGNLIHYEVQSSPNIGAPTFDSPYLYTDKYLYFIPEARDSTGALLRSTTLPGYGVYRLPLQETIPTIDQLEFVCPLPEAEQTPRFQFDSGKAHLLVSFSSGGVESLYVLDAADGTRLQALDLPALEPLPEEAFILQNDLLVCDGFLLQFRAAAVPDRFQFSLLTQEPDGTFHLAFNGVVDLPGGPPWGLPDCITAAFDGERLAIAASLTQDFYSWSSGCLLAVCDASGTQYTGVWESSLDRGEAPMCQVYDCGLYRLTDGQLPLSVSWR